MRDNLHPDTDWTQEPKNRPEDSAELSPSDGTDQPDCCSPSPETWTEEIGTPLQPETSTEAPALTTPAVHAESPKPDVANERPVRRTRTVSDDTDDILAILDEADARRAKAEAEAVEDAATVSEADESDDSSEDVADAAVAAAPKRKKKKKRKRFSYVDVLKGLFPWRGDRAVDVIRKIVFLIAIIVFAVCLYLVLSYFIDLYRAKRFYGDIQSEIGSITTQTTPPLQSTADPQGEVLEYYDYNEIAEMLLDRNSDLVGYIKIDGTPISYPVVQKKSNDPNVNTNDYYLYRAFDQSSSKSGCIFMDFRCHFDEVVNHRRVVDNSENLLIYGHNMNNESMFGSLKHYYRNYYYYSEHPLVTLYSLYNTYTYKIFSVFIVDGEDTTSARAFDCWNTFEFGDEAAFYDFVNNAKKRNIITNDVDVTFGDQILTLYTCNSLVANGKLIIMARQVRDGEDPFAGTQNGWVSDNILWPESYYDNHSETFDPEKFVPYG